MGNQKHRVKDSIYVRIHGIVRSNEREKKTPTLPHYFSRIKMQKLQKAITRSKINCNPDHKTTKKEEPRWGKTCRRKRQSHKWRKKEKFRAQYIKKRVEKELTRVEAERYGRSFLQELLAKRARHACFKNFPLHSHHLTRHPSLSLSLYSLSLNHIERTHRLQIRRRFRTTTYGLYWTSQGRGSGGEIGARGILGEIQRWVLVRMRENYVGLPSCFDFGQEKYRGG